MAGEGQIATAEMDSATTAVIRRRDLLLTLVMWCIGMTPAWLLPPWLANPWLGVGLFMGIPAVIYSWRYAPWVPTPAHDLPRILKSLDLSPDHAFCDLGAGDGRMLTRVHDATGAHCTGIEVSPLPYLVARGRLALLGGPGMSMVFGDLHRTDLSRFDVLYIWGTAYWVGRPDFGERMNAVLRPGARLVSYHYPIGGLVHHHVDESGARAIYTYIIRPDAINASPQVTTGSSPSPKTFR